MFEREVFTVHCSAKAATLSLQAMLRPASIKNKSSLRKQKQQSLSQTPVMRRLIARQKKLLLSLAGIGSSGFSDISVAHDAYLKKTRQ
jgi:hypothetical protein